MNNDKYKEYFIKVTAALDFFKSERQVEILKDIEKMAKHARKEVENNRELNKTFNKYYCNLKYNLWNEYELSEAKANDPNFED